MEEESKASLYWYGVKAYGSLTRHREKTQQRTKRNRTSFFSFFPLFLNAISGRAIYREERYMPKAR